MRNGKLLLTFSGLCVLLAACGQGGDAVPSTGRAPDRVAPGDPVAEEPAPEEDDPEGPTDTGTENDSATADSTAQDSATTDSVPRDTAPEADGGTCRPPGSPCTNDDFFGCCPGETGRPGCSFTGLPDGGTSPGTCVAL
jgi:hypothetical protein